MWRVLPPRGEQVCRSTTGPGESGPRRLFWNRQPGQIPSKYSWESHSGTCTEDTAGTGGELRVQWLSFPPPTHTCEEAEDRHVWWAQRGHATGQMASVLWPRCLQEPPRLKQEAPRSPLIPAAQLRQALGLPPHGTRARPARSSLYAGGAKLHQGGSRQTPIRRGWNMCPKQPSPWPEGRSASRLALDLPTRPSDRGRAVVSGAPLWWRWEPRPALDLAPRPRAPWRGGGGQHCPEPRVLRPGPARPCLSAPAPCLSCVVGANTFARARTHTHTDSSHPHGPTDAPCVRASSPLRPPELSPRRRRKPLQLRPQAGRPGPHLPSRAGPGSAPASLRRSGDRQGAGPRCTARRGGEPPCAVVGGSRARAPPPAPASGR